MKVITGKYAKAKVLTDKVDDATIEQIQRMCSQQHMNGLKVRVMPDAHKGMGSTIGTTIKLENTVVPNLVGVDIGCSVLVANLGKAKIDLNELDRVVHKHVPSGHHIHKESEGFNVSLYAQGRFDQLRAKNIIDTNRAIKSLGTLGGGKVDCLRTD